MGHRIYPSQLWRMLVITVLATSCAGPSARQKETEVAPAVLQEASLPAPVLPVEPVMVGRILIVGAGSAFVVFQAESGATVVPGEVLEARFAGASVAKVKVNEPNPKFPKFHVADVLHGAVEKGYELVRPAPESAQ